MQAKRVLVVDDQSFEAQVLKDMLERNGFVVDVAYDGSSALAHAGDVAPDIVLLDMIMPGMDGVETCRRFKEDSQTFSIPIIVVTAKKDKDNLVDAFEAGADDYLSKPVEDQELLARIKSNLIRKEAMLLLERANQIKKETLLHLEKKVRDSERFLFETALAMASSADARDILHSVVGNMTRKISSSRCSLVLINRQSGSATVVASSNVPGIMGLRIQLDACPEICEVVRTGEPLIIDDVTSHPLLPMSGATIVCHNSCSLFALPAVYCSEVIGVLMFLTDQEYSLDCDDIRLYRMVATMVAAVLKTIQLSEQA